MSGRVRQHRDRIVVGVRGSRGSCVLVQYKDRHTPELGRIIWIVLLAAGLLVLLVRHKMLTSLGTMETILYGVQYLMGMATAVLLLTPTSNRWFKKKTA